MRRFGGLLLVLFVAACGSGAPSLSSDVGSPRTHRIETPTGAIEIQTFDRDSPTTVHMITATPAAAWEVLPAVYESIDLPANMADSRSRQIGVVNLQMPRRIAGRTLAEYFDCGSKPEGPNALFYAVTMTVVTQVIPEGSDTRVETRVEGSARPRSVSSHPVKCTSKGTLERLIANSLQLKALEKM